MNDSVREPDGEAPGTYQAPRHGWTCFHCGVTFHSPMSARTHFGESQSSIAGCLLAGGKLEDGDRPLLRLYRAAEREATRLREDIENETSSTKAFYDQLESHLRGYKVFSRCRSIQDVFNIFDSMEGRALAAEERLAALSAPASA